MKRVPISTTHTASDPLFRCCAPATRTRPCDSKCARERPIESTPAGCGLTRSVFLRAFYRVGEGLSMPQG